MRKLFHLTGRAWSFISANIPGEHFVLNHGGQPPAFFEETQNTLRPQGTMKVAVKDIEGCSSNMNKSDIQQGLTRITTLITQTYGYDAVYILPTTTKPCSWKEIAVTKKSLFAPY
jgi:hypothetical protein